MGEIFGEIKPEDYELELTRRKLADIVVEADIAFLEGDKETFIRAYRNVRTQQLAEKKRLEMDEGGDDRRFLLLTRRLRWFWAKCSTTYFRITPQNPKGEYIIEVHASEYELYERLRETDRKICSKLEPSSPPELWQVLQEVEEILKNPDEL